MRSNSYTAIAGSTGSSLTSAPIPVSQMTQFSVVVSVAGDVTASGTVTVQASNDVGTGFPVTESSPSPWVTLPAPATATVAGNGQVLIPITNVAYQFIRVVYTRSAGTGGVIVCTVDTTGPSPGVGFWPGGDLGGTVTSQTVIGIQGNPVSSTAPVLGDSLVWNGTEWAPAAGGGGGGPAMPAAWGDEYLWWKMDDAANGPAVNSGSAGSASITTASSGNDPFFGIPGPYSSIVRCFGGTNSYLYGATGKTPPDGDQLTVSVWLSGLNIDASNSDIVLCKAYPGSPQQQFALYMMIKVPYQIECYLRTGPNGSGSPNITPGGAPAQIAGYFGRNSPVMLSMTYDGALLTAYANGIPLTSVAATGNIDWGTATPTDWYVGANFLGLDLIDSGIYDVRIAPSCRTSAQLIADFKAGMGYNY